MLFSYKNFIVHGPVIWHFFQVITAEQLWLVPFTIHKAINIYLYHL